MAIKLEENLDEIRIIRFFCPKCGKEMWQRVPMKEIWAEAREFTTFQLEWQLICTDCLLRESEKPNESNSS